MLKTWHTALLVVLIVGAFTAAACTQTYSQPPLTTPTAISTGLFVSPFPSGQDPLQIVADLGTQTAAAKTAQAGGGSPAPSGAGTLAGTPATQGSGSANAPLGTSVATLAAATVVPSTRLASQATAPVMATSVVNTPSSYTLQPGEFPYCIARRFNINPDQLLSANGLTDGSVLFPGKALIIPQGASPFPGERAWHDHPDTYTVDSSDTTIYGIACYYGDAFPQDIAAANGLSVSSELSPGQQLTIP